MATLAHLKSWSLASFICSQNQIITMKREVMDFTVVIEQDDDGWYIATVPELQGCHTQGKTMDQVLERLKEAIELCVESDNVFYFSRGLGQKKLTLHCSSWIFTINKLLLGNA